MEIVQSPMTSPASAPIAFWKWNNQITIQLSASLTKLIRNTKIHLLYITLLCNFWNETSSRSKLWNICTMVAIFNGTIFSHIQFNEMIKWLSLNHSQQCSKSFHLFKSGINWFWFTLLWYNRCILQNMYAKFIIFLKGGVI